MRLSLLFLVVLTVLAITVSGRPSHKRHHGEYKHDAEHGFGNATASHPTDLSDPKVAAFFEKIHADLKARNYSRPANLGGPNGARGVDISAWAGQNTWSCLKNNGYSFAIVRNYEEACQVDPNGVHSVANAWAAGISHVDIYIYPSWTCGWSASNQVDQCIDSMGSIPFGQLWFDIESGGAAGPDTDHNWLVAAVNQAVGRLGHARVGIYSSKYGWSVAMGNYGGFSSFPIWYAHYDNNPSFGDWQDFAGWTSPAMKQFAGDANVCSFDVDLNWY
jgi:GH25 family lysozyme M1 (1,4-beta-N-acetylmuramidase)